MINSVELEVTAIRNAVQKGRVISVFCVCNTREGYPATWGFPIVVKNYGTLPELLEIRPGAVFVAKGKIDYYKDKVKQEIRYSIVAEKITIISKLPTKNAIFGNGNDSQEHS